MEWNRTAPCDSCPFRRRGGVALRPARAAEIADLMLHPQGGTFSCHKTTGTIGGRKQKHAHCAGALIFALKNETLPQLARISERLGLFDGEKLLTSAAAAYIFDTRKEMLAEHRVAVGVTGRRAKGDQ